MMTPERTQDPVVFSYWMNITLSSHNGVFCWECGHMETMYRAMGSRTTGTKAMILFKWRGNRDQHIIYRMTVNVCE